jgi:L-arabinose 1-dehydrogenase [NAD(P)+]
MAPIAVTGAAGRIGRETLAALGETDHRVRSITHRAHDDIDGRIVDVTDRGAMVDALDDCDVVIHLAGDADPEADWESVLSVNVDGTRTVYEAAVRTGCDRVVFASTNHVTHAQNLPPGGTWDDLVSDTDPIHIGDPIRTDSFYAVSKVAGEALGDYYAHRHGIEALDLRIGWYLTRDELAAKQSEPDSVAHYARATWLSPRDCRHAMQRAVEADLPDPHVTVNLTSRNAENYLSLVEAMRALDYRPRDDSSDALADRRGRD